MTPPPRPTLFPYTTLFRSGEHDLLHRRFGARYIDHIGLVAKPPLHLRKKVLWRNAEGARDARPRSEEHTSELQSQFHLVCRLLLEKKKARDRGAASSQGVR